MPCCVAVGCSNSDSKGFHMKRFPRDPERRKIWAAKVRRENWEPKDSSFLCEVHFAPEMFEQNRADGKKLLKYNAIPKIFPHIPQKTTRKPPMKRSSPGKVIFQSTVPVECNVAVEINKEVFEGDKEVGPGSLTPSSSSSSVSYSTALPPPLKHRDLKSKLAKYSRALKRTLVKNKALRNKLRQIRRKQKSSYTSDKLFNKLKDMFSEDQLNYLITRRASCWNNDSIKNALKLKFACGTSGYQELLKQKFPLPSLRTLRRKIQAINFTPGVLQDVFDFLEIKVRNFKKLQDHDCCIVMDEMAIRPGRIYDNTTNCFVGYVTTSQEENLASHALVFMLAGITNRWKQAVAYHFTGESVSGDVIINMLMLILEKTAKIGLRVVSITSDMGSANQSFWKLKGITAGRFSVIKNSFPHPFIQNETVYIIADPVHLFKNIRSSLLTNGIIEIPCDILQKHNLKYKYVCLSHLQDLVSYQEKLNFKLSPKLHEADLAPSHFGKMKVSSATNVMSHSVSSGLKFLGEELNKPDYFTTAWFLDQIERWFKLMTSRHPLFALSKKKEEIYNNSINFLKDFINLFEKIKIGQKWGNFKPCQKGVLISTKSILDLQHQLLNEKSYEFVLTGRFTQDCLENLFSLIRAKQPVPNALQFKDNLKLIMLSQYMKDLRTGSYDEDNREEPSDFFELLQMKPPTQPTAGPIVCELPVLNKLKLNNAEMNSLYCISGYLISSIKKTNKHCDNCIASIGGSSSYSLPYERLTKIKNINDSSLFFCKKESFEYILQLEEIFQNYIGLVESQEGDLKDFLLNKMKHIEAKHINQCHNLKEVILNRFLEEIRMKHLEVVEG